MRTLWGLALGAVVMPVLAGGLATSPCLAWEVEPGSRENVLALEIYNLEPHEALAGLEVTIAGAPEWVRGIIVEAPASGPIAPGERADVSLRFDVAAGAPLGARGDLALTFSCRIGSESQNEWQQAIPLEVVGQAEGLQSDCCTSLEIAPTGVGADLPGSAGLAGEDRLTVESFPNPSTPASTIRFTTSVPAKVEVTLHDVAGRLVRVLASGRLERGTHDLRWDGRAENGEPAESGIYFVWVRAGEETRTAKLVLTR